MSQPSFINRFLLAAALAIGVAAIFTAPPRAAAQDSAQQAQPAKTTATGCLSKTDDGAFQLATSDNGAKYALTAASDDLDLSAHVGHTITVTGTLGQMDPNAASDAPKPLTVSELKMVSDHCGQ
ncbi:MAG: hypothetical protein ACRD1L_11555 [Terriglobales bacterium]